MKKTILSIILFLSINLFHAQEIIWNKKNIIGLIPSKDWTLKTNNEVLSFELKTGTFNQKLKGSIMISTSPTNNWSLNKLWNIYVVQGFPKLLKGFVKINEGKSKIDTNESKWIEHLSESNGVNFHGLSAAFVKNKKLYIVTCTSTPEFYESIEKDFNDMIESIKVKTLPNNG